MTHLEIIEIRTTGKNHTALEMYLASWQAGVMSDKRAPQVKIYRHAVLDSDFSIHLRYDAEAGEFGVRVLGDRLVSALKEFGLVNQTRWVEKPFPG